MSTDTERAERERLAKKCDDAALDADDSVAAWSSSGDHNADYRGADYIGWFKASAADWRTIAHLLRTPEPSGTCAACEAPVGAPRLCDPCQDAMIEASQRIQEKQERRNRPLSPIERMIDQACGHAPTPPSGEKG